MKITITHDKTTIVVDDIPEGGDNNVNQKRLMESLEKVASAICSVIAEENKKPVQPIYVPPMPTPAPFPNPFDNPVIYGPTCGDTGVSEVKS